MSSIKAAAAEVYQWLVDDINQSIQDKTVNFWQTGHAIDTIIDYLRVVDAGKADAVAKMAKEAFSPKNGAWGELVRRLRLVGNRDAKGITS